MIFCSNIFNLTVATYQTYRQNDRGILSNLHELVLIIKSRFFDRIPGEIRSSFSSMAMMQITYLLRSIQPTIEIVANVAKSAYAD
jgi:hypothetical protein